MKLRDKAGLAWSNLGRRKARTLLTATGVVVGITTVVTMVSLIHGVQNQVREQFEKLGLDRVVVSPPSEGGGGGFPGFSPFGGERSKIITDQDIARWKSWPQVTEALPNIDLPFGVQARWKLAEPSKNSKEVKDVAVRLGGDADRRGLMSDNAETVAGNTERKLQAGEIVVSQGAIKRLKTPLTAQQLIGKAAVVTLKAPRNQSQNYTLKIVGVSDQKAPILQIATPDRLKMRIWWDDDPNALKVDGYDSVTLRSQDVSGARTLAARLKKEKWQVLSIDALLEAADRIFTIVGVALALVGGIALFVAAIGIVNTMIMAIYERTREIGTLKAMGASRGDIRTLFMLEAGMIGLLGGVLGLAFSWVLGRGLNSAASIYARTRDVPLPDNLFLITPILGVEAIVFAIFIGVVAGLYPANRASKLDPLHALRHE